MISNDQKDVIEFLSRSDTYGTDGSPVERIDTHISALFLAGSRVFKLKRAVKFPYLDFSTIEKRREACESEIEINRRTAPDIYRGIIAVTKNSNGELCLAGKGEVIDWLVEMNRFDQAGLFDRLAQKNALTSRQMEDLAAAIAGFHESAEVCHVESGRKFIEKVIKNNRACFAEINKNVFDSESTNSLTNDSLRAWSCVGDILDMRALDGKVRHCHGDLHLRNIVLIDGKPTLFDAIEFSREFSDIDVLYDLAFLLMDIDHRQLRHLANIVLNRYLDLQNDTPGMACLPLFMSMRAAVRAHVSAAVADMQTTSGKAKTIKTEAQAYLMTAQEYLKPSSPSLIAVGGLSGSGKSRLAQEIAPMLGVAPGARIARSDVLRKRLAGKPIYEKLSPEGYSDDMTEKTYNRVYNECEAALKAGYWAIADAVFAQPEQRALVEQIAVKLNVPFYGFWLNAPEQILKDRVQQRQGDPSDADQAIVERQTKYELGKVTWNRIDSARDVAKTMSAAKLIMGFEADSSDPEN